jgi:hypothetical protein
VVSSILPFERGFQNGNENDTDGAVDFFCRSLRELWLL